MSESGRALARGSIERDDDIEAPNALAFISTVCLYNLDVSSNNKLNTKSWIKDWRQKAYCTGIDKVTRASLSGFKLAGLETQPILFGYESIEERCNKCKINTTENDQHHGLRTAIKRGPARPSSSPSPERSTSTVIDANSA
jgi:hypothetical protein